MRCTLLAAAVLAAVTASAQHRPNFSGTWIVISPEKSAGEEETIRHDESTFAKGHHSSGSGHHFSYSLDGTESRNVLTHHGQETVMLATASWQADALVIIEMVTYPDGRKREQKSTYRLDAKGLLQLRVEETANGTPQPAVTVVYKKKS